MCLFYSSPNASKGLFGTGGGDGRGRDLRDLIPPPRLAGQNLQEGKDFFLKFPLPFHRNLPSKSGGIWMEPDPIFVVLTIIPLFFFNYLHFTQSITKTLGFYFYWPIFFFKLHLHQSISSSSPSSFFLADLRSSFISIDRFLLHLHQSSFRSSLILSPHFAGSLIDLYVIYFSYYSIYNEV